MIRELDPIKQSLIASLFTWGVTALGAAVVFIIPPYSKKFLDISLGFAAGVMTAASFWSLLAPAIELSESKMGALAFVPVSVGFAVGAAFVYLADRLMPKCVLSEMAIVDLLTDDASIAPVAIAKNSPDYELKEVGCKDNKVENSEATSQWNERYGTTNNNFRIIRRRFSRFRRPETSDSGTIGDSCRKPSETATSTVSLMGLSSNHATNKEKTVIAALSWRRIVLLIIAITVHNIPEGLAVGVAFGSIGKTAKATFESAFNLALGIGLQNFPEGLAVSLPLAGFGHSKFKAFFYGQLSGMVEPIAALAGATAVLKMEFVLPYALSFAAGAMIYVVVDDIIPEAQRNGNGKLASIGAILGFIIMMSLDVGLG